MKILLSLLVSRRTWVIVSLIFVAFSCSNKENEIRLKLNIGDAFQIKVNSKTDALILSGVTSTTLNLIVDSIINDSSEYVFKVNVINVVDSTLTDEGIVAFNSSKPVEKMNLIEYRKYTQIQRILEESQYMHVNKDGSIIKPLAFSDGNYPFTSVDFENILLQYKRAVLKPKFSWQFFSNSRLGYLNTHQCKITKVDPEKIYVKIETTISNPASKSVGNKICIIDRKTGMIISLFSRTSMSYGSGIIDTIRFNFLGNINSSNFKSADSLAYYSAIKVNSELLLKQYVRDFSQGKYVSNALNQINILAERTNRRIDKQLDEIRGIVDNSNQQIDLAKYNPVKKPNIRTIDGHEFVFVKGGNFVIGENDVYVSRIPEYLVRLTDFYIGKTEVSYEQFDLFCTATNKELPQATDGLRGAKPVVNINREDALAYCKWLSNRSGKTFFLPTSAQWEYAARGGLESKGYKYAGSDSIDSKINDVFNSVPNELGIYGMSNYVFEMCDDVDGAYYLNCNILVDPKLVGSQKKWIIRGGCSKNTEKFGIPLTSKSIDIGFRIACKM